MLACVASVVDGPSGSVLPPDEHDKSLSKRPVTVLSVPPDAEGGRADNTPTASTCARQLFIPEAYTSVAALAERFEYAFEHAAESGFQYA